MFLKKKEGGFLTYSCYYFFGKLFIIIFFLFLAGGQAKTLMFVQINPDTESYSETMSTLKFAERVSGVELGAARSNKEGKDIKELLEQVFISLI